MSTPAKRNLKKFQCDFCEHPFYVEPNQTVEICPYCGCPETSFKAHLKVQITEED